MNVVILFIGLGLFYGKSFYFFAVYLLIFLKFTAFPLLKRKQIPLSKGERKYHKKRDRHLVSKLGLNFQIFPRNKKFIY